MSRDFLKRLIAAATITFIGVIASACGGSVPAPTIERVIPLSPSPGGLVVLTGDGFALVAEAWLAGKRLSPPTRVNHSTLTLVVPDDAQPGTHTLELRAVDGRRAALPLTVSAFAPAVGAPVVSEPAVAPSPAPEMVSARAPAPTIDRFVTEAVLPPNVAVIGRREMTNEAESEGKPELLKQFQEAGRQGGVQFFFSVDGVHRVSVGVNQYAAPEGARRQFTLNGGGSRVSSPITVNGLGDIHTGAKLVLDGRWHVNNIHFVRGRYYITVADFVSGPEISPDIATALAQAVDAQISAQPSP